VVEEGGGGEKKKNEEKKENFGEVQNSWCYPLDFWE